MTETDINDDKIKKVQNEALKIFSIYENLVQSDIYSNIKQTIESRDAIKLMYRFSLREWKELLRCNIAALTMYYFFEENTSTFNNDVIKQIDIDNNIIINIYRASLPLKKGTVNYKKSRHNTKPIHLKMNLMIDDEKFHLMYHLEFRGHLYCSNNIIYSIAVGYIYPAQKQLRNTKEVDMLDGIKLSSYVSKDNHIVFKLVSKDNANWHASDLCINFIGGTDWYHEAARKIGINVIDAFHSDENI